MKEQHHFKKASWLERILRRISNSMFSTFVPRGIQRHHTSFFTEKITDYLAKDVTIKNGNRNLHLIVDAIDLGENPFAEEIKIHFHVLENSSSKSELVWGPRAEKEILFSTSAETITGNVGPTLVFTFTSELPWEDNLSDFQNYVVNHGDKAKDPPTPFPSSK